MSLMCIDSCRGQKCTVCCSSRKTLISVDLPAAEYNWCRGKVHDIAYLGGHSVYYIKLGSGQVLHSFMVNADRFAVLPTWGDDVFVHWADDSGLVLRA